MCDVVRVADVSPKKEAATSPSSESFPGGGKFGAMSLMNALAACVMSARLRAEYRRWSLQQLVAGLSALGRASSSAAECAVDTAGDLPSCATAKLEAHQNRVTGCMFHWRKGLLATRFEHYFALPSVMWQHFLNEVGTFIFFCCHFSS